MPKLDEFQVKFNAFCLFCEGQIRYYDSDPHVQVLKWLSTTHKFSTEVRLWLSLLYMAYYQDGSCWAAFTHPEVANRKVLPPLDYPISYQRRNLFGGRLRRHFEAIYQIDSLETYFKVATFNDLIVRLKRIYGNGRWASYTTAELLIKMGTVPGIFPTSYEILNSSGPKQGLEYLGMPGTEQGAIELRRLLANRGLNPPIEVLESVLCNWSRINKGDFYLGQNIDRQQSRILKVEAQTGCNLFAMWEARQAVFDNRILGELHGWRGVNKTRAKAFVKTVEILDPCWLNR